MSLSLLYVLVTLLYRAPEDKHGFLQQFGLQSCNSLSLDSSTYPASYNLRHITRAFFNNNTTRDFPGSTTTKAVPTNGRKVKCTQWPERVLIWHLRWPLWPNIHPPHSTACKKVMRAPALTASLSRGVDGKTDLGGTVQQCNKYVQKRQGHNGS